MIVGGEFSVACLVMPPKHSSDCDGKDWCSHPEFTLKGCGMVCSVPDPLSVGSELHAIEKTAFLLSEGCRWNFTNQESHSDQEKSNQLEIQIK